MDLVVLRRMFVSVPTTVDMAGLQESVDNICARVDALLVDALLQERRILLAQRVALIEACQLFTDAAYEIRDLLNSENIACPAAVMLAAEKAKHAIMLVAKGGAA